MKDEKKEHLGWKFCGAVAEYWQLLFTLFFFTRTALRVVKNFFSISVERGEINFCTLNWCLVKTFQLLKKPVLEFLIQVYGDKHSFLTENIRKNNNSSRCIFQLFELINSESRIRAQTFHLAMNLFIYN